MKILVPLLAALLGAAAAFAPPGTSSALAQAATTPASAVRLPADPWPRVVDLSNGQVLVYQPQVNRWVDNQLDFRAALAIKPDGAKDETFGVITATARTQVDKVLRTVTFENLRISRIDFPTLPDRGAAYAKELQTQFAKSVRTIALDRLESSLALAGIKPPTVAVQNNPPQVIVSYSPAILVPIDGAPVLKAVPGHPRAQRVINTRSLILQDSMSGTYYIHVYDGWLQSSAIGGPWSQGFIGPLVRHELDAMAQTLSAAGTVDLLDGSKSANPKPSLANGVPTIYHEPGADRADRLQGAAGLRADRGHATAVGGEHHQRRADRHRQQLTTTCCCPDAGSARRRSPDRGRSCRATRCRPTLRASRRTRWPVRCCRRWPERHRRRRR